MTRRLVHYDRPVRKKDIAEQTCSIARSAAVFGDPWSLLILREAFFGHRRFADFVDNTGAQPSVVSARLKQLVEAGVFERREYSTNPVRHEYRLTAMGRDLQPVMLAITAWGDRHLDGGLGPPVVNLHTDCGHPADPTMVCGHCAEPVTTRNIEGRPGPGLDRSSFPSGSRS